MRRQTLCIPLIPLVLFLCLSGCQGSVQENNLALALRADFLAMDGCSGTMDITADYGERVYAYTVSFSSTQETDMTMVITAPQEVAGITATIAEGQTYLTFDGVQLETGPLNEAKEENTQRTTVVPSLRSSPCSKFLVAWSNHRIVSIP